MNILDPITTIMTTNPVTISPEENLKTAQEIFEKYKIHHIPVVSKGELVGMLSKSDFSFFKRGFGDNPDSEDGIITIKLYAHNVESIMTKGIGKLETTDRINVALDIFSKNLFHALPVLEDGRLVGIITTHDIIRTLMVDNEAVAEYK